MTTPSRGPRSGDDTYDLIDDALYALADRRSAWLGDDLTAITLIASLIDQAERFLPELVTSALLNGHTWDQIAAALATSPEQAQLRYAPHSPIAATTAPAKPQDQVERPQRSEDERPGGAASGGHNRRRGRPSARKPRRRKPPVLTQTAHE